MAVDPSSLAVLGTFLVLPAEQFCLFLIISLTVNLEFGYTGIPNFGKVLFVAVGAFMAGSLSYRLMIYVMGLKGFDLFALQAYWVPRIDARLQHDPLLAVGLAGFMLAVGAGMGGLFGFLSSYPAIKLREDYLGMLLLAAGEFFGYASISYVPFLGGSQGLSAPDPVLFLGANVGQPDLAALGVLALAAGLIYLYSERVGRSPLGRMLRAVRDNEVASEALGKDNVAIRRNMLIVGSALAGIAGVLWVFYQPYIAPGAEGAFNRQTMTFIPFVIVILGGAANNRGVLLGTFIYMAIVEGFGEGLTYFINLGYALPAWLNPNRIETMFVGILLILILLRRPSGLVPEKPSHTMKAGILRKISKDVDAAGGGPTESEGEQDQKPADQGSA
jgi:branched-chain amino acid transport system permease protein